MKFIKYPTGDWWEWDVSRMRAYNIRRGHHDIDENSLGDCEYAEYDSWHDLYVHTGYNPLIGFITSTGWIDPQGEFYPCTAHEADADMILSLVYGEDDDEWGADTLIERGWIKVTTSCMFEYYCQDGHYRNMTPSQKIMFVSWMDLFHMRGRSWPPEEREMLLEELRIQQPVDAEE